MSYFDDIYEPVILGMGFGGGSGSWRKRKRRQHFSTTDGVLCGAVSNGKKPLRKTELEHRVRCSKCIEILQKGKVNELRSEI